MLQPDITNTGVYSTNKNYEINFTSTNDPRLINKKLKNQWPKLFFIAQVKQHKNIYNNSLSQKKILIDFATMFKIYSISKVVYKCWVAMDMPMWGTNLSGFSSCTQSASMWVCWLLNSTKSVWDSALQEKVQNEKNFFLLISVIYTYTGSMYSYITFSYHHFELVFSVNCMAIVS